MGLICSADGEKRDDDMKNNPRAGQRRRLSVTPGHVDSMAPRGMQGPDRDYVDMEKNLTDAERKSMGGIRCGARSNKGRVPYNPDKVNQDRFVIRWALGGRENVALFGVFDGHGEHGHHVSEFVKRALPRHLAARKDIESDTPNAIFQATAAMVAELDSKKINTTFSGTTAIYCVKVGDTLFVANIGDSRCALGTAAAGGKVTAIGLSDDQKPENPEEKKRILAKGGRVEPLPGLPGEDCGPHRVWLKTVDVPGLAMSRSIGDKISQRVGVISVPEIKTHKLTSADQFMVLASDGVWEFMENEDVIGFCKGRVQDPHKCAVQLAQMADQKWRAEEDVIDDITCVIVRFK